ncbi:MAG: dTDP-4-dehydrorhamnose reductase [Eubacteriaceae bacterium]|jgi:dTDP-4-dehydrorhamnose reductase|nr:dTDP-4-dehydrorhamnose reductase [Eubacteriaceae bacterium]
MNIKKVLITGGDGQLGRALSLEMDQRKIEAFAYDLGDLNITDAQNIDKVLDQVGPEVVINCAAITNVDGCETNREQAFVVNAEGPRLLAEACQKKDIALVQVSTDYVFDGTGIKEKDNIRPYIESDEPNPKTVYGASKAKGEENVMGIMKRFFIVRTAWLYGDGANFVKTMLQLSKEHPELTVVNDQVGTPTSTKDLAIAIADLIQTEHYGIYHGTCEGQCSWYDFTVEIFAQMGIDVPVRPVTSKEFVRPAPRPAFSVLENKALKDLGMNRFRPWQEALADYLNGISRHI